ncbi:class I SAM-dependent methyltransferase [Mucilaginibacter ginkgonis]|uniref:Class I SAM-dependent methyltransferase n=1 Tax=Mucilaginibacter ginkgonis TaxID=2682091 RepID=A0A6I4IMQ3_9SPHI|nr:class I SAM-dependent methyltransferase [Mucilaginibacter ginkgonis]QQL50259.1 class I SAM-dependent methyltransferase [Mucilaginibacter ginkgonis]
MKEISLEAVAEKYNHLEIIWDEKDKWHTHTKAMINAFIKKVLITFDIKEWKILNAGSAGYSYDLEEKNILHVDIAAKRLENLKNSLVADIQKIPLRDQQFDLIICVGSVINYCDPPAVLKEFKRLLKTDGKMILEFENSYTLELIGKKSFNRKAVIVNSFYNGESEKVWFFSEKYILELAALYNFTLVETFRCHILSPLIYRIFKNEQFAAKFAKLDSILRDLPILNKFSSNTICLFTQC